ncbi:MAG: arsenate reductase ArsC [Thermodesulfobacteriota bacterium]
MSQKKKVLFICTHNSARSQMAEGILNKFYGDRFKAYSAGTKPLIVNPYANKAMRELGIDISKNTSNSIDDFNDMNFDLVITVCDSAKETCPHFHDAKKHIHKSFTDPSIFKGSDKNKTLFFRQVRDEISEWIRKSFAKENLD